MESYVSYRFLLNKIPLDFKSFGPLLDFESFLFLSLFLDYSKFKTALSILVYSEVSLFLSLLLPSDVILIVFLPSDVALDISFELIGG